MTAPTLTIRRLSVTTHLDADRPGDAERVARLLRGVAEHRLDRALTAATLPPGTWCIRRLDVPVRLDLTRPDPALAAAWATELVSALLRALAGGGPEVVRYHRDLDAVTDLICGAATGRTERSWAWTRIGLLGRHDPAPAQDPRAAIVAALRRRPQLATGAIAAALRRVSLPALHRALGPTGWIAVAGVVLAALAAGCGPPPLAPPGAGQPAPPGRPGQLGRLGRPSPDHRGRPSAPTDADITLARALLSASPLAETVRRCRLRPDPSTVEAWAVLAVAEADASVLRRRSARGVLAAVAQALADSATPGRSQPENTSDRQAVSSNAQPDSAQQAGMNRAGEHRGPVPRGAPENPEPATARLAAGNADDADHGYPTEWAGLLFLLATATAAGIPDVALDDPVLAGRPLPWVLQGVAGCLGLSRADPAVAAFAGVDPRDRPQWESGPAVTDEERVAVHAIAERWAAVTAEALAEEDREPLVAVTLLMRRRGRISYQPGWIEIELYLDQVDVAVRRAGLDLDPGWVPWLGAVVRFVYV